MQRTWKTLTVGVVFATALSASAAFAAQNVANTSQKGSLLIFPQIDVRAGRNTIIRIANDANSAVNLKCYYVNHAKGRADFHITLTKKQAVAWEAAFGFGDPYNVNAFPSGLAEIGPATLYDPFVGELVCFAVNAANSQQISWNHLSGTASVYDYNAGTAYEYNSWNFTARNGVHGRPHGTAGTLVLDGLDAGGSYDACPAYNIVHFTPTGATDVNGNVNINTEVAVSSCYQDLRQDFVLHWTKIQVVVWNSEEVRFTGAYECANSTHSFLLTGIDVLPGNTSASVLRTQTAHAQLRGTRSNQCPQTAFTEAAGLVAVAASFNSYDRVDETPGSSATGVTTNTAGTFVGFVLWDVESDDVPEIR